MENPLKQMIRGKKDAGGGIPSFCCANKIVIEAILDYAKENGRTVLLEATSNQVNQEYGYMNMNPEDFCRYVYDMAAEIGIARERVIVGGDHLGPLPWACLEAGQAMEKARMLVRACVRAGYKKIHLDTSMRLGDDPTDVRLSDTVIAERGIMLLRECEKEFADMLKENPEEIPPVYVIGSEVPIPGGSQDRNFDTDELEITSVKDFEATIREYRDCLSRNGIEDKWEDIIAIVVQPGVEFGNDTVKHYDPEVAKPLCRALAKIPNLVFEGHSTDFQTKADLKNMMMDGIAITKVGPALTFILREALFSLCMIEKELVPEEKQSHFIERLEKAMEEKPDYWEKYYHEDNILQIEKKYSYFDRSRYYMSQSAVEEAIGVLLDNIDSVQIPPGMLHQFMPLQYQRLQGGESCGKGIELVKMSIKQLVDDYYQAAEGKAQPDDSDMEVL